MGHRATNDEEAGLLRTRAGWTAAGRTELDVASGYRLWSQVYDSEQNALIALEEPVVDRWLDRLSFPDALDAGTGTGRHALRLASRGARVTAVDASQEMLVVARAKASAAGLRIHLHKASLDKLPFSDERFDLVICALVLTNYITATPIVTELARVTRPGGHLIITDFHPEIVEAGARTAFRIGDDRYVLPNPGIKVEDYLAALRRAGLAPVETVAVPLADAPPDAVSESFRMQFQGRQLGLMLLARKPRRPSP